MKTFTIALFAALLRAQEPAGTIQGSLRDAISRAPLAGASIALRGPAPRSATTGPGGEFWFEQLPPGDYEFVIRKSGYVDSETPGFRSTLRLKPGAVTETAVIDLTPFGALEGAVLDEAGKPLPGVVVTLGAASHTTDKEGRFGFEDIIPGPYPVIVNVPHEVRARNLVRDPSTGDYYGYAPAQYYPGADDPRLAFPVTVPAGVRLRNIDLRLRRTLLVEFTGRVVQMAGREPLSGAHVQLAGAVSEVADSLWRKHPANADGTFRFSLLQPGAYTLAVFRPDISPLPYLVPIEIGRAGVEDREVAIPPFTRLEGRIQLRAPETHWMNSAAVTLRHHTGGTLASQIQSDGTFDFDGVPAGEFFIDVRLNNLRTRGDSTRRYTVGAIRFGSQSGFRKPVTVAENGNPPIEIQLSDEPAGIAGRVISDAEHASYLVTVASLAPRRPAGLMIASTPPEFQFPDLAPGDYEVTARRYAGLKEALQPGGSCDESVRVTVRDGAVSTITLRPCP
ncbi:MAG TPA: carboxypeptidase regulatory-like domain-containing protein [bacterium]|nr:carboxypeptidase regulatory-like domain-containing protein [bacterium]